MRKSFYKLMAAALCLCACDKTITIDHGFSAEFPPEEELESVSVSFGAGSADIVISDSGVTSSLDGLKTLTLDDGGTLICYKSLALFTGAWVDLDTLLEDTFWTKPSLQWIFTGDFSSYHDMFTSIGFVDCFKARGLVSGGTDIYASSNTYDKISALTAGPVSFTVTVKEEVQ